MPKKVKFPQKLAKYLEKAGVKHNVLEHKTVYTAYDAAATMGKKLNEIAKSLLVIADKDYYLVLLPAYHNLDKLPVVMEKKLAGVKKAVFASGSFNHSVEMAVKDFVKLENAMLGSFGIKKKVKAN